MTISTAEIYFTIVFIVSLVILGLVIEFNKKNSDHIKTITVPNFKNRTVCEPSSSSHIRKQGIGAVQSIFARFRKATEDYLIQKGADISGNLSKCIMKAYETGKINEEEKDNCLIMKNGGNLGAHKHEAENYMKGQSKIKFTNANNAAKKLGIEIAAYL